MKGFLHTFIVIGVLALITLVVYNTKTVHAPIEPIATSTVSTSTAPQIDLNTGDFLMSLYEMRTVQGITLHVWAVKEDSRCPIDVQCIWAGRVKIALNVGVTSDTSTKELEQGQSIIVENKKVTLVNVLPTQKQNHKINDDEYRFIFKIESHVTNPVVPPPHQGACYVGGCSAQLCSDQPDMVSTCEWTERYACYKDASCTRQANGTCGWTETPELMKCIDNAK
jgi:hypothetical protein